jgi:hypothetical protein
VTTFCADDHQGKSKKWCSPNAEQVLEENAHAHVECARPDSLHDAGIITIEKLKSKVRVVRLELLDGRCQNAGH